MNCEVDLNECESQPCLNGGNCHDFVRFYVCDCAQGFQGTNCEVNVNECQSDPCQNGALCEDGVNSYSCTCVQGYNGTHCELEVNECESQPCLFGATCRDGEAQFTCDCIPGYTGECVGRTHQYCYRPAVARRNTIQGRCVNFNWHIMLYIQVPDVRWTWMIA